MHCGRLRRQTETPSALHFVIVCASNSVIHVQRSQLGTCCHSSQRRPRHPGCPCNDQIPPTDRWLKFQYFFVTLLFPLPLHCVRLRRQTKTPSALHFVIVCTNNLIIHVERLQLEHATTAHRRFQAVPATTRSRRWLKFQCFFVLLFRFLSGFHQNVADFFFITTNKKESHLCASRYYLLPGISCRFALWMFELIQEFLSFLSHSLLFTPITLSHICFIAFVVEYVRAPASSFFNPNSVCPVRCLTITLM